VTDSAAPVPLGTLPPDTDPTTLPACWWALLDLHPWEGNPQVHPPAQVATLTAGIRAHGFTTVLQAHWPTCTLIAGHARREALLGLLEEQGGGRAADVASAWCWLQGEEEAARAVRAGGPFRHRPGPCATLCPVCLDAPCTCPR